ncbi:MAG: sigma-70 family RNA polymerase sigma factor [Clostridium sp.]|uniref:sigma-70 family RNA polymerase sigma factor n=1 Tax=Clostridium sp. TaxID=1506 RepID=UPI002FC7F9BE
MENIKLVKIAKKGSKEAFSSLIKLYEKDLYRVSITMVKNNEDALDCIQDTILKAYEKIETLKEEKFFKTWLLRILINNCNNLINSRKKIVDLGGYIPEEAISEDIESIEIKEYVDGLEDQLRILIVLYYFEDMGVREISTSLKIPEGTVKSRLHRARGLLSQMISKDMEGLV